MVVYKRLPAQSSWVLQLLFEVRKLLLHEVGVDVSAQTLQVGTNLSSAPLYSFKWEV